MGSGQAIIVVAVAAGSEADELGVRPGLRLTAISDPIRRSEVWRLQDRPSLKNIRELIKMRSADTITLEFEQWEGPVPGPMRGDLYSATRSSSSSAGSSVPGSAAGSVTSSMDGSSSSSTESIGDRLQRQYQASQAAGRSPTAVEQRQQRRQEYMDQSDQRDDRPLLLGLFAAFLLPPLIILLVGGLLV